MLDLFNTSEMMMLGLVLFSSFWIFLFNYRQDNKDKHSGHGWLILLDLILIGNVFGITVATYFISMIGIFFFWNFIDIYQLGTIADIDKSGRFGSMVPGAQGLAMAVSPAVAGYLLGDQGDYQVLTWMLAGLVIVSDHS